MNYVYLLRCRDDTFYCGWTNDLASRVAAHNSGTGAKYTRSRLPVELVYYEACESKSEAMSREWHIKKMSRPQKAKLVAQNDCKGTDVEGRMEVLRRKQQKE